MATNIPNVSFPYISIKLAKIDLTWKGDRPDYFTSLKLNRYIDKASTGTINITYAPGPNDDPNAVEEALVQSKGDALLKYGHVNGHTRLQRCLIHSYTVGINNGVLTYSLDFVSRSVVNNWTKIGARVFNKDSTTKEDIIQYMKDVVSKIRVGDQPAYTFRCEDKDFEIIQDISISADKSPFAALIQLANSLRNSSEMKANIDQITAAFGSSYVASVKNPSINYPRYYYAIEIDDSRVGSGEVILRKIDTMETAAEYTFNWGTKDSDVLSWEISYQGAVALARARGETVSAEYTTGISGEYGKLAQYKVVNPDIVNPVGDTPSFLESLEDANYNHAKFVELADHCYNAKLTVIGQPGALTIGKSIIQVNPMINGKAHHSQGKYKVIGIEENLNSDRAFTTTYSLYKLNITDQKSVIYPPYKDDFNQIYFNGAFHSVEDIEDLYEEAKEE